MPGVRGHVRRSRTHLGISERPYAASASELAKVNLIREPRPLIPTALPLPMWGISKCGQAIPAVGSGNRWPQRLSDSELISLAVSSRLRAHDRDDGARPVAYYPQLIAEGVA